MHGIYNSIRWDTYITYSGFYYVRFQFYFYQILQSHIARSDNQTPLIKKFSSFKIGQILQ